MEAGAAVALLVGVVAAAGGGELFVRGVVGIAEWLRVPAGIVAVTVAAFATSSPELVVSVLAATEGEPDVALGNALGSNVANLALIGGIAVLLGALEVDRTVLRRDYPAIGASIVLTIVLGADGELGRGDGIVLLAVFAGWLGVTVVDARRGRDPGMEAVGARRGAAVGLAVLGLVLLVVAGRLVVASSRSIGEGLGIDPFVVGATIVAVATSVPELATVLIARYRGHDEVGLGTILGSNVFNGLWIVGIAAVIAPIPVAAGEVLLSLGFAVVGLALVLPGRSAVLPRGRAPWLLASFVAYLALVVVAGPAG